MTPKIRNAKLNKSRRQELFEQGVQFLHEKDYEDAYTFFLEAAQNNHARSTYELGLLYVYGFYPERNYEKGFHYLNLSLELGEKGFYEDLIDVEDELIEKKDKEGIQYLRNYLEHMLNKGSMEAAIYIGDRYANGTLYEKNAEMAIHYYKLAAESGINMGYECLGEMYYLGEIVTKDYKKAYEYLTAFDGECSYLKLYYLGEMYRFGQYVAEDAKKAEKYYRRIVESENPVCEDMFYGLAIKSLERMRGSNL